jgi:hypothetical protein
MYSEIPELFDYTIRLVQLKPKRCSLDIVVFHLLGDLVYSANHALTHYLTLTLQESFLQNSHYGSPYKKWAGATNDNFKEVAASVKALIPIVEKLYFYPTDLADRGDGIKVAPQWLRRVRDEYDCCEIKADNCLTLSSINLRDWIDLESGWFRCCSFLRYIMEHPVVTRTDMDIADRSVLVELQSIGLIRVNQMRASYDSFAGWLRRNCTIEDVTALHR